MTQENVAPAEETAEASSGVGPAQLSGFRRETFLSGATASLLLYQSIKIADAGTSLGSPPVVLIVPIAARAEAVAHLVADRIAAIVPTICATRAL